MADDHSWPVVWEKARGMYVRDVEGKRYLDLTAAFGVAACGHAPKEVVKAGVTQMKKLMHAMGDVHPHEGKANLAKELSRWTFERWTRKKGTSSTARLKGKVIFCNSGFEAVEAALKTAHLATKKPGVIAFKSAYHGLGYGTLSVTHRKHFRGGFLTQLKSFGHFVDFPTDVQQLAPILSHVQKHLQKGSTGAVLLEPIQSRAGVRIPLKGFLVELRKLCDQYSACLIVDEIYTGFGRTGDWFASEHDEVIPDLICVGKALTGGFPMSACIGRADLMDEAWPPSQGEAIHTSTYLGHPVGCAMALAQLNLLRQLDIAQSTRKSGSAWMKELKEAMKPWGDRVHIRGRGLMIGIEIRKGSKESNDDIVIQWTTKLLHAGIIALPEGDQGEVLGLSPPLIISKKQMQYATKLLTKTLNQILPQ
ncbi:MAG: aspartate aminotransferase family protein [Verrucomicrobia bacterium]|nr:aspartate aminotransferase family protein [Verrucomicrobiota bacterium]